MGCCIAEVAMFVFGIVTLVKGSFTVSRNRIVRGVPAYVIGAILTAVLPVALLLGFVAGFVIAMQTGKQPDAQQLSPLMGLDLLIVLVALIAVVAIGFAYAKEPERKTSTLAPGGLPATPAFRPADPNNPYSAPQSDERDRLLDEMQ